MEEEGGVQNQEIKSEEIMKENVEEEEDRISSLPDCLLIEILCRLRRTKYAIRTGVLSKRWQHLWTFVHTLIFHESDIHISMHRRYSLPKFISFINKTITQCQSKKLNKFELYIGFHVGFESQLNNFIHHAINCSVQELYLMSSNLGDEDKFELKDDMFFNNSCFTHLKLERCKFSPSGVISWNKLKSLCVSHVKLDEDLIQNILSGSPLLETLNLEYCDGYRRLDITSKSVKNLVFSGYNQLFDRPDAFVDIIEIDAPNVLSLTIQNFLYLTNLLLLNVSSLLKAYLNYTNGPHQWYEEEMLEGFILKLHHVKELKVGKRCCKVFSRLKAKGLRLPSSMKYIDDSYSDSD